MATSNRRDVELALRVTTLGQQGIAALEQQVRDLAAEGGAAAPKFQALADEIARLGETAATLGTFGTLAREIADLSAQQNVSAETAAVLYGELQKLSAATKEYEQAENAAKNALEAGKRDLADKREALQLLRVETDAAAKKTDQYQKAVQDARLAIIAAEREVRNLKAAQQEAKAATDAAGAAESELQKRYNAANREAQASAQVLRDRNAALDEARGTLAAAGVATDDLSAASFNLVTALNAAGTAAQHIVTAEEEAIAAAKAHAAEEEYLAGVMARSRKAMEDAARAEADGIIADFERMQQAERNAAAAAQDAARTLDQAFRTTGTRSVAAITAEIEKVRAAMGTIRSTAGLTGNEIDAAMLQGQRRIAELERELRAATGQTTLLDRATGLLRSTFGQFASAFTLVELVQRLGSAFFTTNKELDSLRFGLNAIYGSTKLAGDQIDYLRAVANRGGVAISDIQQEFLKFSASTKAANIPLAQSNALFEAVVVSSGRLGLSGENVGRILNALGQMAAKGVVSMEELRQQLGDSLPGALGLLAKGLGISEQQLIKLVESGNLATRDAFPALTKALQSMRGDVDTISSSWERFKNVLTISSQTAGDSGWTDVLKGGLMALGAVLGVVLVPLQGLFEIIFGVAKAAGVLVGALATLTNPLEALGKIVDDAGARLSKMEDAYFRLIGMGDDTAKSQEQVGAAMQATGQSAQAGAVGVGQNTAALGANAAAAQQLDLAHTSAGQAIDKAAATALLAGKSWVQLSVAYAENSKQLANAVEVASKSAKAVEIEGAALEKLAKLRGDERAALDASSQAAEGNLKALQNLEKARETELAASQRYADQLKAVIQLQGDPDGSRTKQLQALQQHIDLLTAETDKTRQQVAAAREDVAIRQVAKQAYEDNSGAVDKYRQALVAAQQVLLDLQVREAQGKATREQVAAASIEAAKAQALLNDALADYARRVQQQIELDRISASIAQGRLALDLERANSMGALAKTIGDEALATQANVKAKQVERDMRLANAAAISLEAARIIEKAEADKASLAAQGKLTDEVQRDIDARIKSAEVKKLEADRIKESTKSLDEEIARLLTGVQARDGSTSSIEKESAALAKNIALRKESANLTADGFKKNADGSAAGTFNNNLPVDQAFRLVQTGGQGFDAASAKAAFEQAKNAFDDMQAFLKLNPGAASFDYQQSTTQLYIAAQAAYQKFLASGVGGTTPSGTMVNAGNGTTAPGAAPATAGGSTSHTVTISIGGQSQTVNLSSANDASALAAILRQLEAAAGTAT